MYRATVKLTAFVRYNEHNRRKGFALQIADATMTSYLGGWGVVGDWEADVDTDPSGGKGACGLFPQVEEFATGGGEGV